MSVLLVLSAVLSAVTGAFSSARAPEAALHQQAQVAPAAETAEQVAVLVASARLAEPYPPSEPRAVAGAVPTTVALATDRLIE